MQALCRRCRQLTRGFLAIRPSVRRQLLWPNKVIDARQSKVEFHTADLRCALNDAFFPGMAPDFGGPDCTDISGVATLTVRSATSFTIQVNAAGLDPGHAVTLWAFDGTFAGGWVAGGLVGGGGEINFSSNNCIHVNTGQVDPFLTFEPGGNRQCDEMNLSAAAPDFLPQRLMLCILEHAEWKPGDMQAFWT